ncbi:MAG: oligoendopeptidase F [Ardenticatenaceae bacterium]|nr:oligoendopeptidase F [Ardenticatenaceae bacterium]
MSQALPKRHEIPVAHTWDATAVYATDEAWETAVSQIPSLLQEIATYQGRLHEGPAILADLLDKMQAVYDEVGKIYIYATLFHEVDTADPEAAAKNDRARGLFGQTLATLAFMDPELLTIGFDTLRRWTAEEPRLAAMTHYLNDLERQQAHVRSAEVEELLGMVMDPFRTGASVHGVLADADIRFEPAQATAGNEDLTVAQGTIGALLTHEDRGVRRTAWERYADGYLAYKNTMGTALAAGIKQDVFMARARRFGSSLESALAPSNIPVDVFHNTLETFRRHLPTWHRYWRVRRQALGYDKLHVYDVKAPLTAVKPNVPFAQAVDWIVAGMRPLGNDYVDTLRQGVLEQRWVDIYPNQGKRSGAFSTGVQGTHPYILMSYADDLFSMSTLAHELGHSLHSYYTWQNQPFLYARYSLFIAEVASNFNQALVRSYLLDHNDDPDFQIAVIEEAMSNFHRYFFIMPTLARFELAIHERVERGQALTADTMINLMADLFAEGFGEEVEMDRDRVGITWAQFPNHLYANFYVYQYTTGIAGAHALAADVLAQKPGAVTKYREFLKAGSSVYPIAALQAAGVDMTSPEPVEKTFAVLADYVDRLEKLVTR